MAITTAPSTAHTGIACTVCGQEVTDPYYLSLRGICYECQIYKYIPPWYEHAEDYRFDNIWRHVNATRSPHMQVDWLDAGPIRICDIAPLLDKFEGMRAAEHRD